MAGKVVKFISLLLCFLLLFEQSGLAQVVGSLDISNHLAALHNSLTLDTFRPLHLRYLSYDNLNHTFRLFLDKGSLKNPPAEEIENTSKTLLNYFFVGISLPNDKFWVNLRPDAEDNIIDAQLAQTDVGKIMLETDLQLKKDTAQFTSPETPEGRKYWDKLYKKAEELFGTSNITIPTLTRPWIVPDEIIIRETTDSAYIYKATLKVMLEQDYLKDSAVYNFKDDRLKELNEYSSQLIREIIIPKLTKEVNSSKRYASLRQVYYSLIMAQWFKARFKGLSPSFGSAQDSLRSQGTVPALIDSQNLTNLISKEPWSKTTYFKEYQKNFQEGEYNIKEPVYSVYGQTVRNYFSGGMMLKIAMPDLGEVPSAASPMVRIAGNKNPIINANGNLIGMNFSSLNDSISASSAMGTEPSISARKKIFTFRKFTPRSKYSEFFTNFVEKWLTGGDYNEVLFLLDYPKYKRPFDISEEEISENKIEIKQAMNEAIDLLLNKFGSDGEKVLEVAYRAHRGIFSIMLMHYIDLWLSEDGDKAIDDLVSELGRDKVITMLRDNPVEFAEKVFILTPIGKRLDLITRKLKSTAEKIYNIPRFRHPKQFNDLKIRLMWEDHGPPRCLILQSEIMINRRMIEILETDAEFASVIGHELGHWFAGDIPHEVADEAAIRIMNSAGYDPETFLSAIEKTYTNMEPPMPSKDMDERLAFARKIINSIKKEAGKSTSSPAQIKNQHINPGGIDFRSLPIVTQAVTNLSGMLRDSPLGDESLLEVNLDEEWRQIKRMINSRITPSSERIKEYIQTSCAQDNITQDRDKILLCISDILRLEEERCDHTNPTLRDILVVLESMSSIRELKQVFLGNR